MIALDTNVLVASLVETHPHFVRSSKAVDRLLNSGRFLVPSPAVLETYAVLTRLPRPQRMSPSEALLAIRATVRHPCEVVNAPPIDAWAIVEFAVEAGAVSGQIHDAQLAHVAASAGATVLLTWNVRHMRLVAPTGLDIREP